MRQLADVTGKLLPSAHFRPERNTSARNRRRALRWREQVERATGAAMEKAATVQERDKIEAAYAAEVKAGPDWCRIRRGSEFRTPPPACKDRNALAKLMVHFGRLEREHHQKDSAIAAHEGRKLRRSISRNCRAVLAALVGMAKRYDHLFPSLQRLADMALCSRRSIVSALDKLVELGVVVKLRRRKRVMTALGSIRETQDSNAYQIIVPPEVEAMRPRVSTSHQSAKIAQHSPTQEQPIREFRVAEPPIPTKSPNSVAANWRERSRVALEATVARLKR